MPARPRPPLSTREIAAYLEGGRWAKAVTGPLTRKDAVHAMAVEAANDHAEVVATWTLDDWAFWFCRGYWATVALGTAE